VAHAAQPLPLTVLFEDDDLIAVSKPPGLVSHPCYKHPDGTVFNGLLWHLQGSGVHPHLLQRLDKDTSGVMLASKTMTAHARVVRAMARTGGGGLRKEYLAVVHGVPDPPAGEITLRLRRDPADSRRVVASESEGKQSVTLYEVLSASAASSDTAAGRQPREAAGGPASCVLCRPLSGRMHQIRVHLASRGWPIVGDQVYGPGEAIDVAAGRQALHAWRLAFRHPISGAPIEITAPLPPDILALIDHAGLPRPVAA
jgi:23S rRNA pseudouridine1911/1915/1917 synthase